MTSSAPDSALLVMDVQPGVVDRLPDRDAYLARAAEAMRAARSHGVMVIHVVVGFRPGMPEVTAQNPIFGPYKAQLPPMLIEPRPAITPEGNDLVVTKRRVSAFSGSDLEVVLRGNAIDQLVLCGLVTSGVVLSTLCEAIDKDYRLTLLSDLCWDADPEVHGALVGKVFPRRAKVLSTTDWISQLA